MSICSIFYNHLTPLGLFIDIVGTIVAVSADVPHIRRIAIWASPTFKKRRTAMRKLYQENSLYPNETGFEELRKMLFDDEWIDSHLHGSEFIYENFERNDREITLNVRNAEEGHSISLNHDLSDADSRVNQYLQRRVLIRGLGLLMIGFSLQFVDAVFIP